MWEEGIETMLPLFSEGPSRHFMSCERGQWVLLTLFDIKDVSFLFPSVISEDERVSFNIFVTKHRLLGLNVKLPYFII